MRPRLYNRNMEFLKELHNASKVGYRRAYNDLHTATFMLPVSDPVNDFCQTHCIVDVFDGKESAGKYRILNEPECVVTDCGAFLSYEAEHVVAFLLNDVIDGYLELGGIEMDTEEVLRYLLSLQTEPRWQLGRCDFHYKFQYSWENGNLLQAVFSVPTCFADAYHWTYDTSTYPWTLNLESQDMTVQGEIRRRRNMQWLKRAKDSSMLCTRLYCRGSGEGVNQVGISDVNPTTLPYIDADTQAEYGVIASHYIDRSINDPATLYAKGLALLEELKHPRYTYTAKAADLCRATGLEFDKLDEGRVIRIVSDVSQIDLDTMIVEVSKGDVDGNPLDIDVVLSNKTSDIASSIADLANRAAITAQYSQGATTLYSQQFSDNADPQHPAVMRVYIPRECVKINQVLLTYTLEAFRAYETGAAAGGGNTYTSADGSVGTVTSSSGGGTQVTSSEGGETTQTSSSGGGISQSSDSGGGFTQTSSSGSISYRTSSSGGSINQSSNSGGGSTATSEAAGDTTVTTSSKNYSTDIKIGAGLNMDTGDARTYTGSAGSEASGGPSTNYTSYTDTPTDGGDHRHTLLGHTHTGASHQHNMTHNHNAVFAYEIPSLSIDIPAHTHTVSIPSHSHKIEVSSHTHDVDVGDHTHTVSVGSHSHYVEVDSHSHSVFIPAHTHSVSISSHSHSVDIGDHTHTVTISPHTHDIVYGIYEGGIAQSVTIEVDGNVVEPTDDADIDIVSYLSRDDGGKIQRGVWHVVRIIPDELTRITANMFVKTFVTSYVGGNY